MRSVTRSCCSHLEMKDEGPLRRFSISSFQKLSSQTCRFRTSSICQDTFDFRSNWDGVQWVQEYAIHQRMCDSRVSLIVFICRESGCKALPCGVDTLQRKLMMHEFTCGTAKWSSVQEKIECPHLRRSRRQGFIIFDVVATPAVVEATFGIIDGELHSNVSKGMGQKKVVQERKRLKTIHNTLVAGFFWHRRIRAKIHPTTMKYRSHKRKSINHKIHERGHTIVLLRHKEW